MKVDSKRRWKARILHKDKPDIPTYITVYYPELIFWLIHEGYHPKEAYWKCIHSNGGHYSSSLSSAEK